jgi:hypothetical protein
VKKRIVIAVAVAIAAAPMINLPISTPSRAAAGTQEISFKADVLPILERRCMPCHAPGGEGAQADGVILDNYADVMKGTKYGPMVVPGNPQSSNLMRLLDWQVSPQIRMPHNQKMLPAVERDAIRQWIQEGAKDN